MELTDAQFSLIGKVVYAATLLERVVEVHIHFAMLLQGKTAGRVLKGKMIGQKMKMLQNLHIPALKTDDEKESFQSLVQEIRLSLTKRNICTHGTWTFDSLGLINSAMFNPGRPVPVVAKSHLGKVKAEEMPSVVDEISSQIQMLVNLHSDWYGTQAARS
jgi:hypothetical protein